MDNKLVIYRSKLAELPEDGDEKRALHTELVKLIVKHKKDFPGVPIYMKMQFGYSGDLYAATSKVIGYTKEIGSQDTPYTVFMRNNPLRQHNAYFDMHGSEGNVVIFDEEYDRKEMSDYIDYNRLYDHVEEIYLLPTGSLSMPNKQAKIVLRTMEEA